ncbi:hypothetical protein ACWDR3_14545 [Streptomyces sp. NPDC001002]
MNAQEEARSIALGALTGLGWGPTVRAVRINGLDTPWCHDDIIDVVTVARYALDRGIVPGFDGKEAIDPGQVPLADEVFAPRAVELRATRESMNPPQGAARTRRAATEVTDALHLPLPGDDRNRR